MINDLIAYTWLCYQHLFQLSSISANKSIKCVAAAAFVAFAADELRSHERSSYVCTFRRRTNEMWCAKKDYLLNQLAWKNSSNINLLFEFRSKVFSWWNFISKMSNKQVVLNFVHELFFSFDTGSWTEVGYEHELIKFNQTHRVWAHTDTQLILLHSRNYCWKTHKINSASWKRDKM